MLGFFKLSASSSFHQMIPFFLEPLQSSRILRIKHPDKKGKVNPEWTKTERKTHLDDSATSE